MKRFIRNNGLTITLLVLFLISITGQFYQGFTTYNDERAFDDLAPLTHREYLYSGHFISSISENMESEFLQMALFVFLTMCLYQKGSAESKKLPEEESGEDKQKQLKEKMYSWQKAQEAPFLWRIYENSLSLALIVLFILFFFIHAYGSMKFINTEKIAHNEELINYWGIFKEPEFWFESFQNWQSEFFSIAIMGLLSIFLRQKGSSQSKKMYDLNSKTGSD